MRLIARSLGEDEPLWEIVGICHDLDFDVTKQDPSKHGVVAAQWLRDDLPPDALLAIQSHDHRTGISSDALMADALKLADALAVAEVQIGREALLTALTNDDPEAALAASFITRPYLPGIVLKHAGTLGLTFSRLREICALAPRQ